MTTDRIAFTGKVQTEGRRLRGSVVLAGQQTARNGELVEVDPAALMRADASTAVLAIGHQAGSDPELGYDPLRTFARVDNGSLRINRTEQGFDYETDDLPNTTYANDTLELGRQGLLGGTSFEIQGLRSSFSAAPDGTRIRRYTSIAAFTAVTPVVEPAFASTVAAFSQEKDVTEVVNPEPVAAPEPKTTFTAVPAPASDGKTDTYKTAEAFARKQPMADLEAAMENIWSNGEPSALQLEVHDAFAAVYDERKAADAEAAERRERIKLARDMRLGKLPKAPEAGLYESDDYKAAFSRYLRTGEKSIMEQFAQSIAGDGTQGGFAVPESFLTRITERQKAFGGVQRYAENITTSDGRTLPWPTNDDTANSAAIATEGSAVGSGGADLVLGEVSLGAYTYDATGTSNLPLAVSKELIQDAAFDIEGFVSRKLGERLGRKMAADFATANGSSKPKGLFDKSADVMSATTMYAALVEHLLQVDQAYREGGNCRWLMSDTILAKVLTSLDDNGRPLFQPQAESGGQAGANGFLLGYPLSLDQGAGSAVAFGDIYAGYIVRNVRGVTVDVDPYTLISKRQIAFHAWARADGQIQDSFAVSVSSYSGVSADS